MLTLLYKLYFINLVKLLWREKILTKFLPKEKTPPIEKYRRIAEAVRKNGRCSIIRVSTAAGYSPIYFRYSILPAVLEYYPDIHTDGDTLWFDGGEFVKEELRKHKEAVPT